MSLNKKNVFSPRLVWRRGLSTGLRTERSLVWLLDRSVPGLRPGPQLGACERRPIDASIAHQCFSPSPSPFPPLSLETSKYKSLKK